MPSARYGAPAPAKPTIEDVARVAGVSRGTVSRVLNGGHYVSGKALEAVQDAVRATGYVVNASARSLATRRTGCYAFVLSEPTEHLFEDPNFATLLRSVAKELARTDLTVILMICGSAADDVRMPEFAPVTILTRPFRSCSTIPPRRSTGSWSR